MAEKTIPALLNDIWSAYRRAGMTDDLRIIESLAALLLEQANIELTDDLPRKAQAQDLPESEVRQKLQDASEQAGGAGNLFDRYILFRLPDMREGQYPTPRHIVRLMTALAETAGQSVADFACGSGGLLVHSGGKSLHGVELAPEWARIARANLRLHGLQGRIKEGNALRLLRDSRERYARIVMNPPFGAKVESDFGARSETALTNLALDHLAKNGRAALLVPSGLLFSGSQAERKTRQRLVDAVTLEASGGALAHAGRGVSSLPARFGASASGRQTGLGAVSSPKTFI